MKVWLLCALILCGLHSEYRRTPLFVDSYQYLSAAENVLAGRGLTTSLVHFDTERSSGRIPAPLTTFPPLYPETLALAAPLFPSMETAAAFLAGICFVASAGLLAGLAAACSVSPLMTRLALLLYLLSATQLRFGSAVMAEPLFQTVSLGGLLLLLLALPEPPSRKRGVLFIAAGILVGLSYWIRYAGLFFFLSVWVFMALRFLATRTRAAAADLAFCLVPTMFVGALMMRNILISGTWKGGNGKLVHHPLGQVAGEMVRSELHAVLGAVRIGPGVFEGLLALGFLCFAAALIRIGAKSPGWSSPVILPILYVAIYTGGLLYLGLFSVIDLSDRMFYPLLPVYLLLFIVLADRLWRKTAAAAPSRRYLAAAAVLLTASGYLGINLGDLRAAEQSSDAAFRAAFQTPLEGIPAQGWAASHLCRNESIASTDGQTTGYLLHRDTLSLVPVQYSSIDWNAGNVIDQMHRYHIRYLFLYRGEQAEDSPFLREAANARDVPGFRVAAENERLRVLVLSGEANRTCF